MSKSIIYKRPGSPFFYIHGIRKSTGTDNRKLATEIATSLLEKHLKTSKLGDESTRTWDDLVELWRDEKGDKSTADIDERIIKGLSSLLFTRRLSLLQSIADSDVLEAYIKGVKRRTSASTANRHLNTVKAMMRRALAKKWILHMPELQRFKLAESTIGSLSKAEVDAILGAVSPPEWVPVIRLAVLTGMRRANVVGLRWEWINADRSIATIPAQYAKARKTYTAILDEEAREVIGEHKGTGRVFNMDTTDSALSVAFKRACTKVGIKAHFHQLRHTWATRHVENGTPDRVLMSIGGWSSPAMLDRYSHVRVDHLLSFANNCKAKEG